MTVVRGKGRGLELMFAGRAFGDALDELRARLGERSSFYTGSVATAVFGEPPSEEQLAALRAVLEESSITLEGVTQRAPVTPDGELARRRANRPKRTQIQLSESARSLAADFAGARADLAKRRVAVPIRQFTPAPVPSPPAVAAGPGPAPAAVQEAPAVSTHYHIGTVRGGQSLHHVGNLVVVGDVNPGSELVASGDIVVFGALRGVAHAGAQGDVAARVYALELAATQLRIATFIAADDAQRGRAAQPEAACVIGGRITIVPHDQAHRLPREGVH